MFKLSTTTNVKCTQQFNKGNNDHIALISSGFQEKTHYVTILNPNDSREDECNLQFFKFDDSDSAINMYDRLSSGNASIHLWYWHGTIRVRDLFLIQFIRNLSHVFQHSFDIQNLSLLKFLWIGTSSRKPTINEKKGHFWIYVET